MKSNGLSAGGQTPTREDIRRWDAEHVWHPFTQMQEYLAAEPLVVVRAEGHYLIDDRGRRLFDGTSALWCNLFGHRVPAIDAAVADQLSRFAHRRGPAREASGRDRAPRPDSCVFFR